MGKDRLLIFFDDISGRQKDSKCLASAPKAFRPLDMRDRSSNIRTLQKTEVCMYICKCGVSGGHMYVSYVYVCVGVSARMKGLCFVAYFFPVFGFV